MEESLQENQAPAQKLTKTQAFCQFMKFVGFSLSAGIIQIVTFELLYTVIGWKSWWATYLISITLSVLWNFTFNRKFTFKSAANVPVSMMLALMFYVPFVPLSVFGGAVLESIGWDGTLVTLLMMLINFLGEFVWDKYIVFRQKIPNYN